MKKVTAKELNKMDNVLYCEDFSDNYITRLPKIKYTSYNAEVNDWCCEDFPSTIPKFSDSNSFASTMDSFSELNLNVDVPVSNDETYRYGLFPDDNEVFIVFSKDDIKSMIKKLEDLL